MNAKLLSVNVGLPRDIVHRGQIVTTGIDKSPVAGAVWLRRHNLEGDGQADLRVHGGADKAVYAYPFEHYGFWARELGRDDFSYGQFGENFTVEGLLEDEVCIGDIFRIGAATVAVSQPRTPCFKLGLRMGDERFPARFAASPRTGFYLRVLEEGRVTAGEAIELVERAADSLSVRDAFRLRHGFGHDPERWREFKARYFRELDARPEAVEKLATRAKQKRVTLLFGAKDAQHNNAVALAEYLVTKHRTSRGG